MFTNDPKYLQQKWLGHKIYVRFNFYGQNLKIHRVLKQDENDFYVMYKGSKIYLTSIKIEEEFLTWKGVI